MDPVHNDEVNSPGSAKIRPPGRPAPPHDTNGGECRERFRARIRFTLGVTQMIGSMVGVFFFFQEGATLRVFSIVITLGLIALISRRLSRVA